MCFFKHWAVLPSWADTWVGVVQFHSILTPSAWRQRQTPQIKGSASRDCLTSAQSQVQAVTWLAINQGSHRPPPLSVNLLQPLTELRETFIYAYSLRSWIQWKTQVNRCMEGVQKSPEHRSSVPEEHEYPPTLCRWGAFHVSPPSLLPNHHDSGTMVLLPSIPTAGRFHSGLALT